jgi:hypothetical protein
MSDKWWNNDEREIQAIKECIDHWENDLCTPFRDGDKPDRNGTRWEDSGNALRIGVEDCALCELHWPDCTVCPIDIYYRTACPMNDSIYRTFINNPTLANAEAMRDALKKLLEV